MNSERAAQHPGTEEMPEAVRDEVGIVAAAFPARDRHGEEDKGGGRRPSVYGSRRAGAHGAREGDVAPAEAVHASTEQLQQPVWTCVEIKILRAFVLNRRVVLHAIDARCGAPDALVDFHTGLDAVENRRDGRQRPDAQRSTGAPTQRPRGRKMERRSWRGKQTGPTAPARSAPTRRPWVASLRIERSPEALLLDCVTDVEHFRRPLVQHADMAISCALLSRPIEQASQAQPGALRPSDAKSARHAKKRLHLRRVVVVPSMSASSISTRRADPQSLPVTEW